MIQRILVTITCFFSLAVSQPVQTLTVERIFEKPYLGGVRFSNVQWSPDGTQLAYLRADAMEDNKELWLFDLKSKKSRRLLGAGDILERAQTFSREEQMMRERTRQSDIGITSYAWFPDGSALLIPLGGDAYMYALETKEVRNLTSSERSEFDAKLSPDGTCLAYVRDREVYCRDLGKNVEVKLTSGSSNKITNGISEFIAQEEMDRTTGFWWAPDGQTIAYLQVDNSAVKEFNLPNYLTPYTEVERQEYPKAGEQNAKVKVGVVPSGGGQTIWMDLGANDAIYVARVDWHPNGKHLAIQRQSRNQDTLELLLFETKSGKSRLVLREVDRQWVSLHDNFRFLQDGKKFIWSSERDGFQHLYLYDLNGRLISQVTKGSWQVEKLLGLNQDDSRIFFIAMEKSPLERHVYEIRIDGFGLRRLSLENGWHEAVLSGSGGFFADTYSTITRPPSLRAMSIDGKQVIDIEANGSPDVRKYALPAPEFLTIQTDGKVNLHAVMTKPSKFDPGKKYPVIMYVYGGPTSQVVLDQWGAGGGMARSLWHRMMAERGYIVFAVDGHGTPGRGRDFQRGIHKELGTKELEHQLVGVAYLKSLPFVDPEKIMIWGKSYGGFMTCVAMFRESTPFKLGISLAPVVDWTNYDTHYTERYLELPSVNSDGYRKSSPLYFARLLNKRFLLVHGVADDNVHFQDSMLLVDALQRANRQFDFMAYPKSTHAFSGDDVGTHLYKLLARYIQENL